MFNKKKKGSAKIVLSENQLCRVLEEHAEQVSSSYYITTNANNYNLLYRDGQFLGMPTPFGGPLYPFSVNPKKEGSNADKKKFSEAQIVCISKDFNLTVNWGTRMPFIIRDCRTQAPYRVGANGMFYVSIDPSDAARNADKFYSKCLTQRNAENFQKEELRDFLSAAFINRVGAKIQQNLEEMHISLSPLVGVGLQPHEYIKISEELFSTIRNTFADYGLILNDASKNSILMGITVMRAD